MHELRIYIHACEYSHVAVYLHSLGQQAERIKKLEFLFGQLGKPGGASGKEEVSGRAEEGSHLKKTKVVIDKMLRGTYATGMCTYTCPLVFCYGSSCAGFAEAGTVRVKNMEFVVQQMGERHEQKKLEVETK